MKDKALINIKAKKKDCIKNMVHIIIRGIALLFEQIVQMRPLVIPVIQTG